MRQICFICHFPYDEDGSGIGEATHFAVRHNLLALEIYNARRARVYYCPMHSSASPEQAQR